ncbi:hypothetical protein T484DRAFT_1940931 [Baffinella frigidus]|nr:hypothetical protein T484DRAFT_1940931 [Cryptophyta sp. CCMP2293]
MVTQTSGAIAIAGILLLAGGAVALPSASFHSVRAPGLRAGMVAGLAERRKGGDCERGLNLALRGGDDAGAPGYPSYSSPAAAAVNWDEPAADIPPPAPSYAAIPPAPQMAPPKAPPPPPAPTYHAPPPAPTFQAPPAPAADAVAWDQSSVSTFRRYVDMFGWENVAPVGYLIMGLGLASVKAWWHSRGDDDDDIATPGMGRK